MGKRYLLATWDGAGNLPPEIALIEGLVGRGDIVYALAHACQSRALEDAGAEFLSYETCAQFDQGMPCSAGFDVHSFFEDLSRDTAIDLLQAGKRFRPDVILVDCMLGGALSASKAAGYPTIALVHGAYGAFASNPAWKVPIDEADLAISFSHREFEPLVSLPSNLTFVGPIRPVHCADPWTRRLTGVPLVVASLSTGLQIAGNSQLNLLQRICDALAGLKVEGLVLTGRGISPDDLRPGVNVTAERFVRHESVLAQADLFVTHAGHGSVMAGIHARVPMLCMPPTADQPHNAALAKSAGIAEVLEPTSRVNEIREAISRVLFDTKIKERAQEFGASLAPVKDALSLV